MSTLGKKNTAKRKIQIRKYYENQKQNHPKSYSNPFLHGETDDTPEVSYPEQIFKKTYISSLQSIQEEEEQSDDILTGDVNLDDADHFIVSLKLPKRKRKVDKEEVIHKKFIPSKDDSIAFTRESELLNRLKEKEIQGDDGEEEDQVL